VVIVFVAKVGNLCVCSIACRCGDFIIEFPGTTTADTVRDERNEDREDDQADDCEYACYCTRVVEESEDER
jgi:hypothetical protein